MNRIDQSLSSYRRHVALPVKRALPLSQRVWFLLYTPEDERRMVNRVDEFEIATKEAGLSWRRIDLGGVFADWMDTFDQEERDQCLTNPEILESYAEAGLRDFVCARIKRDIDRPPTAATDTTVFALTGLMELYDFVHVSAVIDAIDPTFPGILLVFFPGEREGNTYRFLDARTGWNYLAVPILPESSS